MPTLSSCEERQRLRVLSNAATIQFTQAMNNVVLRRGKVAKEEYDRVRLVMEQARDCRNAARQALAQHKQEHGC